jgi:hypothetical protein
MDRITPISWTVGNKECGRFSHLKEMGQITKHYFICQKNYLYSVSEYAELRKKQHFLNTLKIWRLYISPSNMNEHFFGEKNENHAIADC